MENIVEIKEDVKIGEIILEAGDKIRILEGTDGLLGVKNPDGTYDWIYNHYDSMDLEKEIKMDRESIEHDPEAILDLADENEFPPKEQIRGRNAQFNKLDLKMYAYIYDPEEDKISMYKDGRFLREI